MRNGILIILFSFCYCLFFAGTVSASGLSTNASSAITKKKHKTSKSSMLAINAMAAAAELRVVKNLLDAATIPQIVTVYKPHSVLVIDIPACTFYAKSYLAHIYPSLHFW